MIKKIKYSFILVGLFLITTIIYITNQNSSIIKDRNFRKCIKYCLEEYTVCDNKISKENIGHLGTLNIYNDTYNIKDLDGIKYFNWLYEIHIEHADKIANIEQMETLKKLKHIFLIDCNVKYTLNKIKSNSATFLHIRDNDLKETKNITTNFPSLERLSCWDSQIYNLSLIEDSKSITSLDFMDCTIQSLDGIKTLHNLKSISIDHCTMRQSAKDKLDTLENVEIELTDIETINS